VVVSLVGRLVGQARVAVSQEPEHTDLVAEQFLGEHYKGMVLLESAVGSYAVRLVVRRVLVEEHKHSMLRMEVDWEDEMAEEALQS
jgi:hypothetical protein